MNDRDRDPSDDLEGTPLLTLERDLQHDLRRRAGALRITVPPVESVVDRPAPRDHRWLVVAAAVVAIVVIATTVLRVVDRPESVHVASPPPHMIQPVTLAPESGWRVAVAHRGSLDLPDPSAKPILPPDVFASGSTGWPQLWISVVSPPPAPGTVAGGPPVEVAQPQQVATGAVMVSAQLDSGYGIVAVGYGLSPDDVLAAVRSAFVNPALGTLDVMIPAGLQRAPVVTMVQVAELTRSGIPGDGPTLVVENATANGISSQQLAAQVAAMQGWSAEHLAIRGVGPRTVAVVQGGDTTIVGVTGIDPGGALAIVSTTPVDDAEIDRIVDGIRPLTPDEWRRLQDRCPPPSVAITTPCS